MPPGDARSEAHQGWVRQLEQGHTEALRPLFDDLSGVTYRLCLRMLGSPEDAEETMHDAFLRLEAQAQRYDTARGTVQTFVLTIAHHLCLERLRTRRARPQRQDGAVDDPSFEFRADLSAPPPVRDPLDQVMVQMALQTLPEDDQALLRAMFFDGYSHSELTAHTGLPLGTVKSRLRRALLKLRERMQP